MYPVAERPDTAYSELREGNAGDTGLEELSSSSPPEIGVPRAQLQAEWGRDGR